MGFRPGGFLYRVPAREITCLRPHRDSGCRSVASVEKDLQTAASLYEGVAARGVLAALYELVQIRCYGIGEDVERRRRYRSEGGDSVEQVRK